jgi:multisubunit Na+/H+ antiporter MnhC subunit
MAADHFLECSYSKDPFAGTMAGKTFSLNTGRLKVAMSTTEISGVGDAVEASRIFFTKETTSGPARMARVLPMMSATFLGTIVIAIALVWFVLCFVWAVGRARMAVDFRDDLSWTCDFEKVPM